ALKGRPFHPVGMDHFAPQTSMGVKGAKRALRVPQAWTSIENVLAFHYFARRRLRHVSTNVFGMADIASHSRGGGELRRFLPGGAG
ncbi:MAG: hypothetical protein QNI97_19200, partial [Desulfobacterales bacterium]|nr:hypothetical protein [Desulfobacterales bacterium]